MNPFALSQKLVLGHEAGMGVGVNLGDGRTAPKSQWLSPAWNGYGAGQGVFKTVCPGAPSPCVLEDFVPAALGSQLGEGKERESVNPHALKTSGGTKLLG